MANEAEIDSQFNHLNIIQVNLGRSFKATQTLTNNLLEFKQDISLIQEPYALKNKIIGFSLKNRIISSDDTPKTATIIHNKDIEVFPYQITPKIIITKLKWKKITVTIINCYIPPKENIEDTLKIIERYIQANPNEHIIVAGDFNAKNRIWGGAITDEKGIELLEFIDINNLNVINNDSIPTFETRNGRSWIDITAVSQSVLPHVEKWEVLDTPSESDHKYIQIKVFNKNPTKEKRLTKMGEFKVLQEIEKVIWFENITKENIERPEQLDEIIAELYKRIDLLKNKFSKVIKQKNAEKIAKPWWTPQLEIERKKVRAHRRRYQKARDQSQREVYKRSYYEAFTLYQQHINESKDHSWKEYCAEIRNKNPFNLAYKIATNRIKKTVTLQPILKADGQKTTSIEETVTEIMRTLYQIGEDHDTTQERNVIIQTDNMSNNT